jgi:hypothetical protein
VSQHVILRFIKRLLKISIALTSSIKTKDNVWYGVSHARTRIHGEIDRDFLIFQCFEFADPFSPLASFDDSDGTTGSSMFIFYFLFLG